TQTDTLPEPSLGQNPSFLAGDLAGANGDSERQMFAKFSPDGGQVAFVRANNLHVTDLATGEERPLTTDGNSEIINGTSDWVYEEELGLRDAFRWSPDSRRIAYWRFDQSPIPAFPMPDELPVYPSVSVLRYPKAGAPNSRVRVGVLEVANPAATRWLEAGPDTGQYIARMEWVGSDSLAVLRLPRRQNLAELLLLSASSGQGRTVTRDTDSAYVDVEGDPVQWIRNGRQFLLRSDRSGWRQIYLFDRAGRLLRQLTQDGMDVLSVQGVDERNGYVYVQAATPTPTQRQILRCALDRRRCERVTTAPGTHSATVSPDGRYLVDSFSSAAQPPTVTLHELPSGRSLRVLEENTELKTRLAAQTLRPPEFFRIPMPDGTLLDAYRIVPADFDSTRAYPVLMYVYGGPAAPAVNDVWGGNRYLWHQLLAQRGFVVVSVDNRGAAWRGRDFRKITQYRLGLLESQDQMDAARWLGRQTWVDPQRIGIWGWSYGGYLSALTAARGGELFRAAISGAPVTDWQLYDTIYTERFMWIPQENAEGYRISSPQSYVEGLRARLLLVHGTADDNVHAQNSLQLAHRLQEAGKPFYMMLYPNQTHAISGGNLPVHLYNTFTQFLADNLLATH
ncbi:MAG TPA: alpha/beta fold hydrolase, partial [Longimicrobiaceae bacterium]|nr:alpha/beta fold hydrolase [Longimicrobiaceae bacterium]